MEDLVSIITPSYNTSRFIGETISSVRAQTYQNWELIIVDDCSTDNTDQIVQGFQLIDGRIHYLKNEKNQGAAISRNKALALAQGRWIAFLDSDDLWYPDKLERQISFMVQNGYHFSCTYRTVINEDSTPKGILLKSPRHISKVGMRNYCWVGCLTVMYDANFVGKIQIGDIKKNNDYAIWLKVIRKTDCYCLPEVLAQYRIRSGSISRHKKVELIKWHYLLFHDAECMGPIESSLYTIRNLFFGVIKKLFYVKKIKR